MSEKINNKKIFVFTGAGVSAESGLQTFRDSGGLWNNYDINDVATPAGWENDPQLVLEFYNERRLEASRAQPNEAHKAIARLQEKFEVVVVTQNIDDLHERGGSNDVIHLHGELCKVRSTLDESLVYNIHADTIKMGDTCEKGGQLRPHIVWFGERMQNHEISVKHIKTSAKVLVIGSSLAVYPAAGILKKARYHAEKIIVNLDMEKKPSGYKWIRGRAASVVPYMADLWLDGM
ncbi:NAD-dependent protein deacetylase of SIR2 family [hydrothermal vent metagenome]|uniref:NAD-dependent protein deacetylase of SIR2 family n=1 Tax=hydrothermal vent metagenome TaxID=652676 RepID=A0A3B0XG82_9ZZZZ